MARSWEDRVRTSLAIWLGSVCCRLAPGGAPRAGAASGRDAAATAAAGRPQPQQQSVAAEAASGGWVRRSHLRHQAQRQHAAAYVAKACAPASLSIAALCTGLAVDSPVVGVWGPLPRRGGAAPPSGAPTRHHPVWVVGNVGRQTRSLTCNGFRCRAVRGPWQQRRLPRQRRQRRRARRAVVRRCPG
jgi:hypothetical protein